MKEELYNMTLLQALNTMQEEKEKLLKASSSSSSLSSSSWFPPRRCRVLPICYISICFFSVELFPSFYQLMQYGSLLLDCGSWLRHQSSFKFVFPIPKRCKTINAIHSHLGLRIKASFTLPNLRES